MTYSTSNTECAMEISFERHACNRHGNPCVEQPWGWCTCEENNFVVYHIQEYIKIIKSTFSGQHLKETIG